MIRLCTVFLLAATIAACSTIGNGIDSGGKWITNTAERVKGR